MCVRVCLCARARAFVLLRAFDLRKRERGGERHTHIHTHRVQHLRRADDCKVYLNDMQGHSKFNVNGFELALTGNKTENLTGKIFVNHSVTMHNEQEEKA